MKVKDMSISGFVFTCKKHFGDDCSKCPLFKIACKKVLFAKIGDVFKGKLARRYLNKEIKL